MNYFFEFKDYIDDVLLLGIIITIGYVTTLCWVSFSQEYITNAANKTGATMDGNQTNQTGGGPLEQVGDLGGVFGPGENRSQYLERSPVFSLYCKKH